MNLDENQGNSYQVNGFHIVFVVVQLLSCVQLFETPWTATHQASLSFTISQSLLKLLTIEWVIPSNRLIFCCPLLLPSIFEKIEEKIKEEKPLLRYVKLWKDDKQIQNSCHVKDTKLKTCTLPVLPLLSPEKIWDGLTPLVFKVSCIHFSVDIHSIQIHNKKNS